jgi:hypothetical protein
VSHLASPTVSGDFFHPSGIQYQQVRSKKSLSSDFPTVHDELTDGLLITVGEEAVTAKSIGKMRTGILYPSDKSHAHNEGDEIYNLVNETCDIELSDMPVFSMPKQSPCRQSEDDNGSLSMKHQLGEDQVWENMITTCQNFVDIPTASFLCETFLCDLDNKQGLETKI